MSAQLIKFALLSVLAASLAAVMVLASEPAFRILAGTLLVVLIGPMLLLTLRDTGQALRKRGATSNRAAFWGRVLGVPQALFGLVSVVVGLAIIPLLLHKWWTQGEAPIGNWIAGPIGFVGFGLILMRYAFGAASETAADGGAPSDRVSSRRER
jgi:hypothetical protein